MALIVSDDLRLHGLSLFSVQGRNEMGKADFDYRSRCLIALVVLD